MAILRVFIGYDEREHEAYEVARHSIMRHSSIDLDVQPVKLSEMKERGLFYRAQDPLASTQFTYTRFLVPFLTAFAGKALFFDCDFLWTKDVAEMVRSTVGEKAVWCVKHNYKPIEPTKMDGAVQTQYPRKNWSSLMLFNCEHPDVQKLTPTVVNTATPAYLHRMHWAADESIGALDETWNWLEGHSAPPPEGELPAAIHYTRGGPWFKEWQDVAFSNLWQEELNLVQGSASI